MNNFTINWPRTVKTHSAHVGRTLEDAGFKDYEDAFKRL